MKEVQFEIYQWLVPIIGIYFIARTILQFARKKRTVRSTAIWLLFWITLILFAMVPNETSHKIAKILGFASNINAVIFVALGVLFLLAFYLSATMEKMEIQLTELVRQLAIRDYYKNMDEEEVSKIKAEINKINEEINE